jgi:Dihydrodipicolinate synthetase family
MLEFRPRFVQISGLLVPVPGFTAHGPDHQGRAMVQRKPLGGIISTVVTPFDARDEVDEHLLRREVCYLLDTGVHGI